MTDEKPEPTRITITENPTIDTYCPPLPGPSRAIVCDRCGTRNILRSASSCPNCGATWGWAQLDRSVLAAEQIQRAQHSEAVNRATRSRW